MDLQERYREYQDFLKQYRIGFEDIDNPNILIDVWCRIDEFTILESHGIKNITELISKTVFKINIDGRYIIPVSGVFPEVDYNKTNQELTVLELNTIDNEV
jgi:hypothetical protein